MPSAPPKPRRLTTKQAALLAAVERHGAAVADDLPGYSSRAAAVKAMEALEAYGLVISHGDWSRRYCRGVVWTLPEPGAPERAASRLRDEAALIEEWNPDNPNAAVMVDHLRATADAVLDGGTTAAEQRAVADRAAELRDGFYAIDGPSEAKVKQDHDEAHAIIGALVREGPCGAVALLRGVDPDGLMVLFLYALELLAEHGFGLREAA